MLKCKCFGLVQAQGQRLKAHSQNVVLIFIAIKVTKAREHYSYRLKSSMLLFARLKSRTCQGWQIYSLLFVGISFVCLLGPGGTEGKIHIPVELPLHKMQ